MNDAERRPSVVELIRTLAAYKFPNTASDTEYTIEVNNLQQQLDTYVFPKRSEHDKTEETEINIYANLELYKFPVNIKATKRKSSDSALLKLFHCGSERRQSPNDIRPVSGPQPGKSAENTDNGVIGRFREYMRSI
jgi:hypothetical protein